MYKPEVIDLDLEGNKRNAKVNRSVACDPTAQELLKRRIFNEYVDHWLSLDYQLPAEPRFEFFGVVEYQELVDAGWREKRSDGETALAIAAAYYAKLIAAGESTQAHALSQRISSVGREAFSEGLIGMDAVAQALAVVQWANSRTDVER